MKTIYRGFDENASFSVQSWFENYVMIRFTRLYKIVLEANQKDIEKLSQQNNTATEENVCIGMHIAIFYLFSNDILPFFVVVPSVGFIW